MNIPFLRYFKRDRGGGVATAVAEPPVATIEKPASQRLGKTVVPNVSRVMVGPDAATNFPMSPSQGANAGTVPLGFAAGAPVPQRKISLGPAGQVSARMSAGSDDTALLIRERKIALPLAELLSQIPAELLRPQAIDPERRVIFHAVEIERGMSVGRPTASLRSLYQQAPEVFASPVAEGDATQVPLPLGRVLEQFASFHVRGDQVCDENILPVETPFLQVALEDGAKFGTGTEPLPKLEPPPIPRAVGAIPPAVTSPATTVSTAPAKPGAPIRLPVPSEEQTTAGAAVAEPPAAPPPARLKLSPNGTGASAHERVPASSGPPVPTPLPSTPAPASAPARVPIRVTPPSNDVREAPAPQNWSIQPPRPEASTADAPRQVRLSLREVVRGIPPFQISGPALDEIPENAELQFAAGMIEPQLGRGRIEVSPDQFQAALPEEFRNRFKIGDPAAQIQLPLQQVLENLPPESLLTRGDQERVEVKTFFETPFSQKAAEDAVRLKPAGASVAGDADPGKAAAPAPAAAKPRAEADKPAPVVARAVKPVQPAQPAVPSGDAAPGRIGPVTFRPGPIQPVAPEISPPPVSPVSGKIPVPASPPPTTTPTEKGAVRTLLQVEFDTNEALDAKGVVARVSKLPGVQACAIVFSDGLSLAGNIPADYNLEGLFGSVPAIMKRLDAQIASANLGAFTGITLLCAQAPVTFFAEGSICLAALHAGGENLPAETRARLTRVTGQLAQKYTTPNA